MNGANHRLDGTERKKSASFEREGGATWASEHGLASEARTGSGLGTRQLFRVEWLDGQVCGVKSRTLLGHAFVNKLDGDDDRRLGHRRMGRQRLGCCPQQVVQLAQAKLVKRAAGESGSGPGAVVSPQSTTRPLET
jgi:hypothetical protein